MKNNMKKFREAASLTLQGLSDICGVTQVHLHNLEKETGSCPKLSTAYGIANVLGKTVYEVWPDTTEIVEETIIVRRIKTNNSK